MRNLLTSLIISFALVATASPSFAGNNHEDKKWERDKKEQRHHSKKDKQNKKEKHSKKDRQLHAKLDVLIDALVVCPSNSPERFVDNGDGTICDHETGLMWEQKDAEDGVQDFNNPHDIDNTYTWSDPTDGDNTNPDGTIFTDFLARLNGVTDGFGLTRDQLAGYSDWRLPTIAELQTLLFSPFPCPISPCIVDPVFDPTAAIDYVSFTSRADDLSIALGVNFATGNVVSRDKVLIPDRVRAVRGGR